MYDNNSMPDSTITFKDLIKKHLKVGGIRAENTPPEIELPSDSHQIELLRIDLKKAIKNFMVDKKQKVSKRFNNGKPKVSYIMKFPTVVETFARIMELGACKYGDDNWKLGGKPDGEYIDSMLRHLMIWLNGEEYDQDTGCNHLTHAIWNLAALQQLNYEGHIFDKEVFIKQCEHWLEKSKEFNG